MRELTTATVDALEHRLADLALELVIPARLLGLPCADELERQVAACQARQAAELEAELEAEAALADELVDAELEAAYRASPRSRLRFSGYLVGGVS